MLSSTKDWVQSPRNFGTVLKCVFEIRIHHWHLLHNMLLLLYTKLSSNILPITRHLASDFNCLLSCTRKVKKCQLGQNRTCYCMQQGHGKYMLESLSWFWMYTKLTKQIYSSFIQDSPLHYVVSNNIWLFSPSAFSWQTTNNNEQVTSSRIFTRHSYLIYIMKNKDFRVEFSKDM